MTEEQANQIIQLLEEMVREQREFRAESRDASALMLAAVQVLDGKLDTVVASLDDIAASSGGEGVPPIGGG